MITAHGGALNTGRNTYKYFEAMEGLGMEAIEVDIRMKNGELYLGHLHVPLLKSKRIPLRYAFEFCKKNNKRINCDVKQAGLVKPVQQLAAELGMEHLVYFTGSVSPDEVKDLGGCDLYVNNSFYASKYLLTIGNLPKIKEYLDSFNSDRLKGININYLLTTKELWLKAMELGIGVSIFTVDIEQVLEQIIDLGFDNITTNKVLSALKFREKKD